MLTGKKIELHMILRIFWLLIHFASGIPVRCRARPCRQTQRARVWGDHALALTVPHSIQTASLTLPLIGYPQSPTAQKPATGIAGIVALLVSGISHKKADRIH